MFESIKTTQTYFTVQDFLSWMVGGSLELKPVFQRNSVWNKKQKSYLIDTLLRGFPIPAIILQPETEKGKLLAIRRVVDGQQRLRTVLGFIDPSCLEDYDDDDEFKILKSHNRDLGGKVFSDLSIELQRRLLNSMIPTITLPEDTSLRAVSSIFVRLNSSGTRLVAQEIRHGRFFGEFKQVTETLALDYIDQWFDSGVMTPKKLAQMGHVELTAELLKATKHGISGLAQKGLDAFYEDNDDSFPGGKTADTRVRKTLDYTWSIYEALDEHSKYRSVGWFYPIAIAAMERKFGPLKATAKKVKRQTPAPRAKLVARRLQKLEESLPEARARDEKLSKALTGASTDMQSRTKRLEYVRGAFR